MFPHILRKWFPIRQPTMLQRLEIGSWDDEDGEALALFFEATRELDIEDQAILGGIAVRSLVKSGRFDEAVSILLHSEPILVEEMGSGGNHGYTLRTKNLGEIATVKSGDPIQAWVLGGASEQPHSFTIQNMEEATAYLLDLLNAATPPEEKRRNHNETTELPSAR